VLARPGPAARGGPARDQERAGQENDDDETRHGDS
jgi:hypothetical protein